MELLISSICFCKC